MAKSRSKVMQPVAFDDLLILPFIVAETVCQTPYTGKELSQQIRSGNEIARIEQLQQEMSEADIARFADYVEKRCRAAYVLKAEWFMKIAKATDNSGRDQLYIWVSHWLAAFLLKEVM